MELRDIIATPFFIGLIYLIAYLIRPKLTNRQTKKYYIPALTLKIIGAIGIGLIYTYYYTGGDTFNFHKDAGFIYKALLNDPAVGIRLLLYSGNGVESLVNSYPNTFEYVSQMYWINAKTEYLIIRIVALIGIFCGHSYFAISTIFALFSFLGSWMAFRLFSKLYPELHKNLAIAFLFLPSVILWGSGVLKDSITLGAVGMLVYAGYSVFIERKASVFNVLLILSSGYLIYVLKIYILLAILPCLTIWIFLIYKNKFKNRLVRSVITPVFIFIALGSGFLLVSYLTSNSRKYQIEQIGERTKINAEYLYSISKRDEGSGYYLGPMDGSLESLVPLIPAAINVTLFRPYLWEVKNPLMLMASLESLFFLFITLSLFYKPGLVNSLSAIIGNNTILFCFIFSLVLAVALGLNSFNFGTLSRYKIIILPYFLAGIFIVKSKTAEYRSRYLNRPIGI
jgi:hypothetical protein